MTVREIIDSIFVAVGYDFPSTTPVALRERAVQDVNAAIQQISALAPTWLTGAYTFTTTAGISAYDLPSNTQNVPGPCLCDGLLLAYASTRAEQSLTAAVHRTTALYTRPAFWWVRELRAASDATTPPVTYTVHLAPAPSSTLTVEVEIQRHRPRVVWDDYFSSDDLPIPQNYCELFILPLARASVASSPYFLPRSQDTAAAIREQAASALTTLSALSPNPPTPVSKAPPTVPQP